MISRFRIIGLLTYQAWVVYSINFQFPKIDTTHKPKPLKPNPGFVRLQYHLDDGSLHFYLGDRLFDFRGFNAPTMFGGSVYETEDLLRTIGGFGTPVTRTYTLSVSNTAFGGQQSPAKSHIMGWDFEKQNWIYNEERFQQVDRALAMAAQHGTKLIIPIINQDYGTQETDFVGNFNDLIRHRYNISSYSMAHTAVDWFTDLEIRQAFKKIIHKLLTRKNTFNGRIYGKDDTIFAWETGNEMNWGRAFNTIHDRPAPANWTLDIAEYIKHLSPNTLVMDGSFSRNVNASTSWPIEVLESDLVDIVSYHLYGDGDIAYYPRLNSQVKDYNKALIIGEHGFYSTPEFFQKAYDLFDCPGALIWSIRAHNEIGGFTTHGEGNNIYSYHVPGWKKQTSVEFDTMEKPIVQLTYEASYDVVHQHPPIYPIPDECYPFFATNLSHSGISWKGAAWAKYYEIWVVGAHGGTFERVATEVYDNVNSGTMFVAIDTAKGELEIPEKPAVPVRSHAGFVDRKWSAATPPAPNPFTQASEATLVRRIPESPEHNAVQRRAVNPKENESKKHSPIPRGPGWYVVRPVSVEGYPGPFSKPVYVSNL